MGVGADGPNPDQRQGVTVNLGRKQCVYEVVQGYPYFNFEVNDT